MNIYMYTYTCIYMCVYVYVYMCVCIYIYVTRRGERVLRAGFGDK